MSFRPTLSLSVCLALAALSCAPGAVPLSRCVTAPTRTVTPSPALAVDALDDSPQIPVAGAPSLGLVLRFRGCTWCARRADA